MRANFYMKRETEKAQKNREIIINEKNANVLQGKKTYIERKHKNREVSIHPEKMLCVGVRSAQQEENEMQ